MAENTTKLYDAISGLHETDSKIWGKTQEVSGAVGIKSFPTTVTSVVATDGKISDDLLPGVTFNNKGTDENFIMGSNIKFIGNCNVTRDSSGQLIIRIGDNLNSSTFNMKDGVTDGSGKFTRSTTPYSKRVVKGAGSQANVWKNDGSDTVTIETNGKIHFDDKINTKFQLDVKACNADGTETLNTFTFGGITANGYYTNNSSVTNTAPAGGISGEGAYMYVSNLTDESKKSEGATGYEGNVKFVINLNKLAVTKGNVYFRVEMISGTTGGKAYPEDKIENGVAIEQYTNVGYFIPDSTTKPIITNLSAIFKPKTEKTIGGINYVVSANVMYGAKFENLNNPASSNEANSSYGFNNTLNYAADKTGLTTTTYDGILSAEVSFTNTTNLYTSFTDGVTISGSNCNGTVSGKVSLTDADGNLISGINYYQGGNPNTSIFDCRLDLDSKDGALSAYVNENAPASGDLMVYQGQAQIPVTTDFSSYYGNSGYTAPTGGTQDRAILTHITVSGTKAQPKLIIKGSNLASSIKGIYVSSSLSTLPNDSAMVLGKDGGIKDGAAADDNGSSTRTISLTYLGAGKTELTTASGAYIKIVLAYNSTAKISSVTIE